MPSAEAAFDNAEDDAEDATLAIGALEIGQGVALGSSILRGEILKMEDDGKWIVRFSNGRKYRMSHDQVKSARELFEKEIDKLMDAKMSRTDAASLSETNGALSPKARIPILAEEIADTEECEKLFEQSFEGEVPRTLVGVEFSASEFIDEGARLPMWLSVLRGLAKKLLEEGTETAHQISLAAKDGA